MMRERGGWNRSFETEIKSKKKGIAHDLGRRSRLTQPATVVVDSGNLHQTSLSLSGCYKRLFLSKIKRKPDPQRRNRDSSWRIKVIK